MTSMRQFRTSTTSISADFISVAADRRHAASSLEDYFSGMLRNPEARRALLSVMNSGALGSAGGSGPMRASNTPSTSPLGGALAAIIEYVDRELEHDIPMFDRVDYTPTPEHVPQEWVERLRSTSPVRDEDFVLDWSLGDDAAERSAE